MPTSSPIRVRLSRKALDRHFQGFLLSLKSRPLETRGTYERALREFVRWFRADQRVRFVVEDFERYKRYLTVRKKLSPVSISTYLTAVRRFCDFLVSLGVLRMNPAKQVGGNERPRSHSRDTLTDVEVERLISSVHQSDERGKRDFAMIKLMLGCGLSEIEIVRADVRDLKTVAGTTGLAVQGKGRIEKDEVVILSDDVNAAIELYLAGRGESGTGGPLFLSAGNRTRGARMTTRGVRDRINACLERAGLRGVADPRITPYSLRHTAAALHAHAGASAEEIRERMRLGSIATANLYIQKSTSTGS